VAQGQPSRAASVAHSVRGAAATLGVQGLADAALRLERALTATAPAAEDTDWFADGLAEMRARLTELDGALQSRLPATRTA